MANVLTVTVQGTAHTIDLDRLTFAEGRAVEKVTGQSFGDALGSKSLTSVQALVWITVKRDQPTLAFSDLDSWAIADAEFDIAQNIPEPTDPTQAATAAA